MLKDKLQIILITYNRADCVERTMKQFFAETSPVKDFNFLVLDNNSSDNTPEVVHKWQTTFPNITYQKNNYNVGLSGNIARAFSCANMDYVWVIGDDDVYDFSNWNEVEAAIENNERLICIARYALPEERKASLAHQFLQLTFITGGIYSTKLITDTTIHNAYDSIYTLFPHLCFAISLINAGGHVYVVDKAISDNGFEFEKRDYSYTRGAKAAEVMPRSQSMSWITGYCNALSLLKDEKLKHACIDTAILYEGIHGGYEIFYNHMKHYHFKNSFMQFVDVYLNVRQEHAQRLKLDFLKSTDKEKSDFFELPARFHLKALMKMIGLFLYNRKKTQDKRYLTILGITIVTRRKKRKKSVSGEKVDTKGP